MINFYFLVDYFNKKISLLQQPVQTQTNVSFGNVQSGQTQNVPSQTQNIPSQTQNVPSQTQNVPSQTQNVPSTTDKKTYQTVSKSVEDMNLPPTKENNYNLQTHPSNLDFDNYIPRLVDRTIKLPITKNSPAYTKVKDLIKMHMEYSGLELDFHKLELAKDHVEAAIYYLRNID